MAASTGEIIKSIRKSKGWNQTELANKIGCSINQISKWEKRDNLEINTIKKIAKALNVAPEILLTGKDQTHKKDLTQENDFVEIPMISGRIAAGGGLEPDNTIEIKISFHKDWIIRKGNPQHMSIIRVKGDSMEPTLYSGDVLLIDHDRKHIDTYGGIYAISVNNEIMIKRVELNHKTRIVRVISDNNKYSVQEFEENEVTVNGKLIWFGREYEK